MHSSQVMVSWGFLLFVKCWCWPAINIPELLFRYQYDSETLEIISRGDKHAAKIEILEQYFLV